MTRARRAAVSSGTALAAVVLSGLVACGVSSQDDPQPIEDTREQPVPSQTIDRDPAPPSDFPIAPAHHGPSLAPSTAVTR